MQVPKKTIAIVVGCLLLIALLFVLITQVKKAGEISEAALIKPKAITFDHSLDKAALNRMIRAARLYYTFWDTGEFKYLDAVISPTFIDHTSPAGYPQGPQGQKYASNQLRAAMPDLQCSIEDLLVTGEMITARLNFRGTSKYAFMGHPATEKPVEYIAIEILHVQDGKIVDIWHLEDKLALLKQLGIVNYKE
jgi:predicted ester cyclase